jgi:KDO2-lipid IV(A) lauroyltransferase
MVRAYRSAAGLARALPEPLVGPASAVAGAIAALVFRQRRRMVRRHLRRVLGPGIGPAELRRAIRQSFASYAWYWLDTFRLPSRPPAELRVDVEGVEHLDAAVAAGRGVVVATAHLGAWDTGGAWLAGRGLAPLTVAEALRPVELFDWFVSLRAALGMEVVPAGPHAMEALRAALAAGRVVALICDRDLARRGVDVEFFGERTTLPAGPALLALEDHAALVPAAFYHGPGDRYLAVFRPPLRVDCTGDRRGDVAQLTQTLALELETLIRRRPEQWHLMQPNWPSDRKCCSPDGDGLTASPTGRSSGSGSARRRAP